MVRMAIRECQDEWIINLLEDVIEHIRVNTTDKPDPGCEHDRHERRVCVSAAIECFLTRTGFLKSEGVAILRHVAGSI